MVCPVGIRSFSISSRALGAQLWFRLSCSLFAPTRVVSLELQLHLQHLAARTLPFTFSLRSTLSAVVIASISAFFSFIRYSFAFVGRQGPSCGSS